MGEGEAVAKAAPEVGTGSLFVSADYTRFCSGLAKAWGFGLEEDGDRLSLAFETWLLESDRRFPAPCLRLRFRKDRERIVLESFVVESEDGSRDVSLDAARDALQAWMYYMSD